MLSVVSETAGNWHGSSGKADLGNAIDLLPCQLTRVGSTVKTFTAITVLMLVQEGKIHLDAPMAQYLPENHLEGLANYRSITVKQLLNHTSGLYNYIMDPVFQTASINDPTKIWRPEELLSHSRGKPAVFAPGTEAQYSNTNYILLGDIISRVEGKPFYKAFEDRIFTPLGMDHTQFAAEDPIPDNIISGYIDLYGNGDLINSTHYSGWDYYTADGGLISNPHDLAQFMQALFNGGLLSEGSMAEMLDWYFPKDQDPEGFQTGFGLGIFMVVTSFGPVYLHSGDAIGYFATMAYFPEHRLSVSWAVNANYGSVMEHSQSKAVMERIFETVLR